MAKMEEIIEEQPMTLAEKIVAIMGEVQRLQKDDNVKFGNTNYKALSEEKVTAIMHEKLVKYKIIVYPKLQSWNRENNITHVDVIYRMVNVENTNDFIDIASCGDGADTQDKGSGKAMTYAFKYMWLRTFALPTGEDPDKISSDELDAKEKEEKAKKDTISNKESMVLEGMLTENQKEWVSKKYGAILSLTKEQYVEIINTLKAREEQS